MRFPLLPDWGGSSRHRRKSSVAARSKSSRTLRLEQLESRQMMSVNLGSLQNIQVPGGKSVLLPLTATNSLTSAVNYTFSSSDPTVQLSLVSTASKSLVLNVTGTDKNGVAFSGKIVMHLFEDLAPATTARIEQLVTQGYYNGLSFHRVIDGFMAQGGQTNNGNDTGVLLSDELSSSLTFTSPGLLAMANRGRDTADAEFYITAIDGTGTTNPITLANMPRSLDFRYTIFGQVVSGFDTFEKVISAHTIANPQNPQEISKPSPSITITSASLINDTQDAVLRVFAPAGFNGHSATITVTATNANNETSQRTFSAAAIADTTTQPPFLGTVSNQTTTQGTAVTFNLTSTNLSGGGITYKVADATTFGTPANAMISINQTTGQLTVTPAAGFTGTINLLAGVRATLAADTQANYDTQAFSVTVNATTGAPAVPTGLAVDSASNTGTFAGNGFLTTSTPKLTVTAPTGSTVKFKLNGAVVAAATETAAGSGIFAATLPAGTLGVGANMITATAANSTATSADSTGLSLTFAPDYSGGIYIVPGAAGTSQTLSLSWAQKSAAYNNELGYFIVDSADGSIGGVAPGSAGYAQAALSSATRRTLFAKGQQAGIGTSATLQAGQRIVFYLIQNSTTANFLAKNATDTLHGNNNAGSPLAFFSLTAANPDHMKHTQIIADATTGRVQYNWEDLINLGDSDFNDATITVQRSDATAPQATLHSPGAGATNVTLNTTLHGGKESTPSGDIGVYFADDQNGTVAGLRPGDAGYAAAALAAANSKVLFSSGGSGTKQVTVPAGKYLGFYFITSGTTSGFLTGNSTNGASGPRALFSFDAANPDAANHFRWFAPGQQATNPSVAQLHAMTKFGGNAGDFDSLAIDLAFSA
jgi:cyclophilin family peptidyl-prolyl cis-trans isomerase